MKNYLRFILGSLVIVLFTVASTAGTSIKSIYESWLNDCAIIMDSTEPKLDASSSNYIQQLSFYVTGEAKGKARLHLDSNNCPIEKVIFEAGESRLRHPQANDECDSGHRGNLCDYRSFNKHIGNKTVAESLVIKIGDISKNFDYNFKLILTPPNRTTENCESIKYYFRPPRTTQSGNAPSREHFNCKVEEISWHNFFVAKNKSLQVFILILISFFGLTLGFFLKEKTHVKNTSP